MTFHLIKNMLHTDATAASARAVYSRHGQSHREWPVTFTDDLTGAVGVVLRYRATGEMLAGRPRHGALRSTTKPPRFYLNENDAAIALHTLGLDPLEWQRMGVHLVKEVAL